MKPSKYNYIVPFGEKHVFFNGITQAFFMVSNDHKDAYQTILANPDDNESEFQAFIEKMKVQGFILDDETDEIDMVKKKYHALRCPEQYFLMVLPTYQCNLRCWYCIQNHEDLYMSDETFARVKKLIERKVSDDSVKDFHLSWFGGEPLMEYDKVLELTRFSQNLCNKIGKTFSSAITTNGTLLNPERIEELRDAGVVYYQMSRNPRWGRWRKRDSYQCLLQRCQMRRRMHRRKEIGTMCVAHILWREYSVYGLKNIVGIQYPDNILP